MLELHPTQHPFAFADTHSDFHPYHHHLPVKEQEHPRHAQLPHLDPFYPPVAATVAVSLPSPPSDISPSPPTLPYQPLPTPPHHATATRNSVHGQQRHPAAAYDFRRYSYPNAYSVSPPVTPTDDPPFAPVHAAHPSCPDADDGRRFAFSPSPSAQQSSPPFLGLRVDRRASVGVGFASFAPGTEYGESSQHPQQQQYSPRPGSGYGAYSNTTDSRHPQASSSVHPRGHAPWDSAHHDAAYADPSSAGPLTTQPLSASATSGPSSSALLAANAISSPSALPTITPTATTDLVTTATGAIISHSSRTNPVQTSLPGVAVEIAGSLPTNPPVPIPPLSGPDDAPVLPLAGPGVYPSHHGRRGSAGVGQRDREGLGGLSEKDERGRNRDRDRDRERERDGGKERDGKGGRNSKQYAFVELPGNAVKKRPRRRYDEIERLYQCSFPNCTKAYGTLNHLNAHVTMQKHGSKRSPAEFKELRKQWRQAKKEAEEAERERERQENQRMLLNANGQPYGMLQPVSVPVGMGGGMGMGGHAQNQHARHPHPQSFSHAGPYALHPHQQQQQREYASMAGYEMGGQQQQSQGEYEDYFHDATTQQMQQRRASVNGYPLSPASLYSNPSVGGMGVGGMNVGMGNMGMGVGPRGSISSVGSFDDYAASQARQHEMMQEEEYPGDLDYPSDDHSQSQQQQWHSPGSTHAQTRSIHAYPAAYNSGGVQPTREMHSPLSPHQHPHVHQQQQQDEPLLASHVSLGSNRLPPNSTLLTPYVPPHHGREGNA